MIRLLPILAFAAAVAAGGAVTRAQAPQWEDLAIAGVDAYNRGDYETAAERFRLALALAQTLEEGVQRRINSNLNLAVAVQALGRLDEAEALYLQAIRLQETAHGAADPALADMLSRLARLYSLQENWAGAEPLLRRALSVREDAAGPDHPYTALAVEELANLLLAEQRYREAVVQFERVVRIRAAAYGLGHRSLGRPLTSAGIAYAALDRGDEAEAVLNRALAIWRTEPPPPPAELLRVLEALVGVYVRTGRVGEAVEHEAEVVQVKMLMVGQGDPAFAAELDEYAELLRLAGEGAMADEQAARAAALRVAP